MAVTFDSSTKNSAVITGSATTGTVSATHNVSSIAANLYAVVAVYWNGDVNCSTAAFSVTFGGVAMTEISGGQALFNTNQTTVLLYGLANPGTGSRTVTASFTGMGTEGGQRTLTLASTTYSGVASVGSATAISGSSANLQVPSQVAPMFLNAFGAYAVSGGSFSAYSQTSRSNITGVVNTNNPMVIGDATGTALAAFTATSPVSQWGGVGTGLIGSSPIYDSVGAGATGNATTRTWSHTIGASSTAAVVAVNVGNSFGTPTITVTAGTHAMTLLGSIQFSPYTTLMLYGLLTPPTGSVTFTVTASSISAISANSVAYQGVSGFDTVVTSTSASNQVTVQSTFAACRVVAAHAATPMLNTFTYNGVKRVVTTNPNSAAFQELLLGDAPGAPYVTLTAGMTSPTNNWGAIGVNMTPAPVMLNCSTLIGPIVTSARLADYRVHAPSPLRTWVIPAGQGQVVTTPFGIGQEWTQAYDAVLDYTLDWTEWLATTSDTIANATFTPSDPAVSVVSVNASDNIATAWLTGGLNGNAYAIKVHIVTEFGRQDDRTFLLNIDQT